MNIFETYELIKSDNEKAAEKKVFEVKRFEEAFWNRKFLELNEKTLKRWAEGWNKIHSEMKKTANIDSFDFPQTKKQYENLTFDQQCIVDDAIKEYSTLIEFYKLQISVYQNIVTDYENRLKELNNWADDDDGRRLKAWEAEMLKDSESFIPAQKGSIRSLPAGVDWSIDGGYVTYGDAS